MATPPNRESEHPGIREKTRVANIVISSMQTKCNNKMIIILILAQILYNQTFFFRFSDQESVSLLLTRTIGVKILADWLGAGDEEMTTTMVTIKITDQILLLLLTSKGK